MNTKLSIIIINYKAWKMTSECVDSIVKSGMLCPFEIIVVDNDSCDGSYEHLIARYAGSSHFIKIIQSGGNGGFSKGNNFGARFASGEYLFFFNNDTLLRPLVLDEMITYLECNHSCGALTSLSIDANGVFLNNGHSFPTALALAKEVLIRPLVPARLKAALRNWSSRRPKGVVSEYDWISGSGLLISSDLFQSIGGWSEDYFMYMEDVSLCQEIAKAGKTCNVYNKTGFVHYLGDGSGSPYVIFEASKSEIIYYKKYRSHDLLFARIMTMLRAFEKSKGLSLHVRMRILKKLGGYRL